MWERNEWYLVRASSPKQATWVYSYDANSSIRCGSHRDSSAGVGSRYFPCKRTAGVVSGVWIGGQLTRYVIV